MRSLTSRARGMARCDLLWALELWVHVQTAWFAVIVCSTAGLFGRSRPFTLATIKCESFAKGFLLLRTSIFSNSQQKAKLDRTSDHPAHARPYLPRIRYSAPRASPHISTYQPRSTAHALEYSFITTTAVQLYYYGITVLENYM